MDGFARALRLTTQARHQRRSPGLGPPPNGLSRQLRATDDAGTNGETLMDEGATYMPSPAPSASHAAAAKERGNTYIIGVAPLVLTAPTTRTSS